MNHNTEHRRQTRTTAASPLYTCGLRLVILEVVELVPCDRVLECSDNAINGAVFVSVQRLPISPTVPFGTASWLGTRCQVQVSQRINIMTCISVSKHDLCSIYSLTSNSRLLMPHSYSVATMPVPAAAVDLLFFLEKNAPDYFNQRHS